MPSVEGSQNRVSQRWSWNKSWSELEYDKEPGLVSLDLDPMTLPYELDLDILKIYLYPVPKIELVAQGFQKL